MSTTQPPAARATRSGEVPARVVTMTSTVPLPSGLVAVIWVFDTAFTEGALASPNWTPVTCVKSVPVIITLSPPKGVPLAGEIPVTLGGPT